MSSPVALAGFERLTQEYQECLALADVEDQLVFLDTRKSYRPVLGVSPFGQGLGDMAVFATMHEMTRKLAHMLLVGHYYGPEEDLGISFILSAFTKDAVAIARTAIDHYDPGPRQKKFCLSSSFWGR